MSGTWPMVIANIVWVVALALVAWMLAALATTDHHWEGITFAVVAFALIGLLAGAPLRYVLLRQRAEDGRREAMLSSDAARREYESRLARALEMADEEPGALHAAMLAIDSTLEDAFVEVLLADSSRAHLTSVTSTCNSDTVAGCGCDVVTPRSCPAVRTGHMLRFDDSAKFDACPHLRDRRSGDLTAVCIPVSVVGSSVGVVHAVRQRSRQFDQHDVTTLAATSQQLGSRIGLVRAMSQSQLQASTDPLTGLLNRRSLENEVRQLVHDAQPFALVLADLDHFKVLNDTYGHDAGDRALRIFARLLRRSVREQDLVCRYGGEEFVLVLPGKDSSAAGDMFERIRLELAVACSDGRAPAFTASAGIADTAEGNGLAELVSIADIRLLRAKDEGRNRAVLH